MDDAHRSHLSPHYVRSKCRMSAWQPEMPPRKRHKPVMGSDVGAPHLVQEHAIQVDRHPPGNPQQAVRDPHGAVQIIGDRTCQQSLLQPVGPGRPPGWGAAAHPATAGRNGLSLRGDRRVTFGIGPLAHSSDGYPGHEGETASRVRDLGRAWGKTMRISKPAIQVGIV